MPANIYQFVVDDFTIVINQFARSPGKEEFCRAVQDIHLKTEEYRHVVQ